MDHNVLQGARQLGLIIVPSLEFELSEAALRTESIKKKSSRDDEEEDKVSRRRS